MVYVMSDLHGQSAAFFDILKQIDFSDKDELYIAGDIVDRGPDFYAIYKYIAEHSNVHMLMGNHEKMILDFADAVGGTFDENTNLLGSRNARIAYAHWMRNGGDITFTQLLNLTKEKRDEFLNFIRSLPYYKIIEIYGKKFIICHARPIFYDGYDVEDNLEILKEEDEILWCRDTMPQHIPDNYIVIHGHTPVYSIIGESKIWNYSFGEIYDIDCGCAGRLMLGCLRLDDMKEFYSRKMF